MKVSFKDRWLGKNARQTMFCSLSSASIARICEVSVVKNQEQESQERFLQDDGDEIVDTIQENAQEIVEKAQHEVERSREPWYRVSRRTQILIAVYFCGFVLFGILAWFVHVHPVLSIDVAITREFQEEKLPWLKGFMVTISFWGNHFLVFSALIFLTAVAYWLVRLRLEALFIIGQSVVNVPVNMIVKDLVSRPRPSSTLVEVLQHANGQSFPSGHVMSYVAFWGLLFSFGLILFKRDRFWHYLLLIIPAFFVVMVGPSRIYLGDHWASDVLGGYLFGGLLLGLALWLYFALKKRSVLT
jgi:membrane-associated phospholipid phosphatase